MDISNFDLPKWPQMIVTGSPVLQSQAEDIIFRTDSFLTSLSPHEGGNNDKFNKYYREISGIEELHLRVKEDFDNYWEVSTKLQEELNFVETQYVHNDWASCCYIFGPHGWCSPKGEITYVDNVGKWPEPEELLKDWQTLATAFPYINLYVTLMNGEYSEERIEPVFNLKVNNGEVSAEKGDLTVHNNNYKNRDFNQLTFDQNELGLSTDFVISCAEKVKEGIKRLNV